MLTDLYESGALVASGRASDGRGLLLVVALDVATANTVADYIAKRIDAQRIHGLASATVDVALQAKREGFVCSAVVDEGPAPIGKLLQRHKDVIRIVFFQCSEEEVASLLSSSGADYCSGAEKSINGKLRGFRSKEYAAVHDLPRSSLFVPDVMDIDGEEARARLQPSKDFEDMVQSLQHPLDSEVDDRPGLLVFFPGIPGCGKSACVSACKEQIQMRDDVNRTLMVLVGDKTTGKVRDTCCILIKFDHSSFCPPVLAPAAKKTVGGHPRNCHCRQECPYCYLVHRRRYLRSDKIVGCSCHSGCARNYQN